MSDSSGADASLAALMAAQRAAFARGAPDHRTRMAALARLRDALRAREAELVQAVNDDFGGRAREETVLLELFPAYEAIRHARANLRGWMRRRRVRTSWFLEPSRAYYQYQPLGVVGVIGAWNYQLLLTIGPVVDAIAAGNHVMLKPSEITPRSAAVLARLVADAFPPDYVTCVTGGPDVARAFSSLPFDHLFFTGSTRVGMQVMQAAAATLTPVTLELGGKSPAIVHESYTVRRAAERIMAGKLYNAGQTCVAPDYVLVHESRVAEFEREAVRAARAMFPRFAGNADYTRIVSDQHLARLRSLVDDARERGARVVPVAARDEPGDGSRLLPPALLFDVPDEAMVMREEIFGPVLPVVPYRTLAAALDYVTARPRPLALYYFDQSKARVRDVLARTMSGGVTVNDCLFHLGQHNLPFGGVGPSGMGHYHGFDGFCTFSKKRGVMEQARWPASVLIRPPYGARARTMIDLLRRVALGRWSRGPAA